jgi:polyisoprenoid-binding protein YceI
MTTNNWLIDAVHSSINFSVRHMVISKVRGRFMKYTGALSIDDGDMTQSTVEVTIDAASLETGVSDRDAHLRSPDFLDVAKFPGLRFHGRHVEKLTDSSYRLVGDLTIRDVTREVLLDVEYGGRSKDPLGDERMGFVARAAIDRKDFGLQWNQTLETGGVLVGDRVDIELDVQAVKAKAAKTS